MAVGRTPEEIAATAPYFESKQEESRRDTRTKAEKERYDVRQAEKKENITATPLSYIPSMPESEEDIKARGAAQYEAGKVNPAYVGVISEAERMRRYGDLFASLNYFKEQYLNLMDGLSPDLATAKEHARDLIDKPQVSRGALDELQRRGAVQMEMPEAPSKWNAATQMLVGAIGQAFQNVNQSELSAAEAEQTSSVTAANAAAYQAAEFASFKQNRQRVLEINTQLRAKYQDDLISAMRDYETRADAAAWNYEQQLLDAALNEQRQWYALFGKVQDFDLEAGKIRAEIGMEYLKDKQRAAEINAQIYNRADEFNARLRSEIQANVMRQIQNNASLGETLVKQNMQRYAEDFKIAPLVLAGLGATGSMVYDRAINALSKRDLSPYTEKGKWNSAVLSEQTAGLTKFLDNAWARIKEKESDVKKQNDMFGNLINNVLELNNNGWAVKYSQVSEQTFNQLIGSDIKTTLYSWNLNKSGLAADEFYTPENVDNKEWLGSIVDMSNVAMVQYAANLGRSTRATAPVRAFVPEARLNPVKKGEE